MNLQVIAGPHGDIVWVSGPLPGAVHDLTAARIWGIVAELAASGLVVLGDKGLPRRGAHPHALPGTEQARIAEGRQPRARPAARPGRTRQCPAQVLAHLAQALLLPLARRVARQGHPRLAGPRDWRMRKTH
jgi:hypothetical protein